MKETIRIIEVVGNKAVSEIHKLFIEYADWLDFPLDFQNFQDELKYLPGPYERPFGGLYLAMVEDSSAGCAAFRPFADGICEMKRLYVRKQFRNRGLGRRLCLKVIQDAKKTGYKAIRLDTIENMTAARNLYLALGFEGILPYRHNPINGAEFMELKLSP